MSIEASDVLAFVKEVDGEIHYWKVRDNDNPALGEVCATFAVGFIGDGGDDGESLLHKIACAQASAGLTTSPTARGFWEMVARKLR